MGLKRLMLLFYLIAVSNSIYSQRQLPKIANGATEYPNECYSFSELKFSSMYRQSLDSLTGMWVLDCKTSHTYNTKGYLTNETIYNWEGDWVSDYKADYEYDAFGNLTTERYSFWNMQWAVFDSLIHEYTFSDSTATHYYRNVKREYSFNNNDSIKSLIISWRTDSNSPWVRQVKDEYSYDSTGNRVLMEGFTWDLSMSLWVESSTQEYFYDAGGSITKSIRASSGAGNDQWGNKISYLYDDQNRPKEVINYQWQGSVSAAYPISKKRYVYDSDGNLLYERYYQYNLNTDTWDPLFTYENYYDEFGNQVLRRYLDWDEQNNQWNVKWRYVYNSENIITSIIKTKPEEITLYPNPVIDNVYFKITKEYRKAIFTLYDLQGSIVLTKNIQNNESISLKSVTKGVYIYYINTDGVKQTGKLIKE